MAGSAGEVAGAVSEDASWEEILRLSRSLPHVSSFPSVDALGAQFDGLWNTHRDRIERKRIGTSRLGDPIYMYSLGSGEANHLIVGGVHPNEPIGSISTYALAQLLLDGEPLLRRLDARWHLVPCIDPDGARLNEGWFAEPGDRRSYGRHFYRPAPDEQVEWSFPTNYKRAYFDAVLPETQALMRTIDDLRPSLYASLHNSELGGVFYYVSRNEPRLTRLLHRLPGDFGFPLETGEPESPAHRTLAPAVYTLGSTRETYDYYEALGIDPLLRVSGSDSSEYADRYGTFSLVAEIPYWIHPDVNDTTDTEESYRDLLRRTSSALHDLHGSLAEHLASVKPHLQLQTPFMTAVEAFLPTLEGILETDASRAADPASSRRATVAERFGREDLIQCFRLRYGGMLLRAISAEVAAGVARPQTHRILAKMRELYDDWQREPSPVNEAVTMPIETLAGVQIAAILATALVLREETR